jgi:PAS domain S-box-containing protein
LRDVINARSFNALLGFLIVVQVTFLIIITSLLIAPIITPDAHLLTSVSLAFLFLLCMPLSMYLYRTSTNKDEKAMYFSLFLTYFLLTITALIWYFLSRILYFPSLVPAGKIFGISVYIPVLLTFLYLFREKRKAIKPNAYTFIVFFNIIAALMLLLFVAMNFYAGRSDTFNVPIFTLYIILDIAILSLGSMLAVTSMENQLRYVLSVPLCFYLFSLAGDGLNLLAYLGLYDTIGYTQFFYDGMVVFAGLALLIITLGNVKVTTIEEVNKKLYDARSLMSDLVMQSPDAICIFDAKGKPVQANNAFIGLTCKSQDMLGKLDLFGDAERLIKGWNEKLAGLRNGDIAFYEGVAPISAGGDIKYYWVKIFPTRSSDGAVTSHIVLMADVTDSKRQEEELLAAKNEAELYLDLMSHDINNMDQIALGFLEMVLDKPELSMETKELIAKPLEALESSTNLIRNVKKLQKIKANGQKLYAVDPGQVLRDVIRGFSNLPGRNVTITEALEGDSRVQANELLGDVFSNLIGNAIKHSSGHVAINVYMDTVQENGQGFCRIRIEDDGPGIPDDRKDNLFNRFQKGSARAGGKGLGLYLVKTLVETFHGTVRVEDRIPGESGKGSRFIVMLPAVE